MKIIIIEDEQHAQQKLTNQLKSIAPDFEILEIIDNIESAIKWFSYFKADLIFCDIQLSDGLSFEIFKSIKVNTPIIFTTAFDSYAIAAFKLNSIDYLLKPIITADLEKAIEKFRQQKQISVIDQETIKLLISGFQQPYFQERFLVKTLNQLKFISDDEIAYCFSEKSLLYIITHAGQKYVYDKTLDQLEVKLHAQKFFRINRKLIIASAAIDKIHRYSNSRLKIDIKPIFYEEVIVSRDRVNEFKQWLDN